MVGTGGIGGKIDVKFHRPQLVEVIPLYIPTRLHICQTKTVPIVGEIDLDGFGSGPAGSRRGKIRGQRISLPVLALPIAAQRRIENREVIRLRRKLI